MTELVELAPRGGSGTKRRSRRSRALGLHSRSKPPAWAGRAAPCFRCRGSRADDARWITIGGMDMPCCQACSRHLKPRVEKPARIWAGWDRANWSPRGAYGPCSSPELAQKIRDGQRFHRELRERIARLGIIRRAWVSPRTDIQPPAPTTTTSVFDQQVISA